MTDDAKTGFTMPETSGFEREPEPEPEPVPRDLPRAVETAAHVNGHAPEAASPNNSMDKLQTIATDEAFPEALRIAANRVLAIEAFLRQQRPDEFQVGEALAQFRAELSQVTNVVQQTGQVVAQMSQQRAIQEFMAERNARATALDLAIKALPEAERMGEAGPLTITTYAEAFLGWLKGGMQA